MWKSPRTQAWVQTNIIDPSIAGVIVGTIVSLFSL
jgi:hypothetical protein